MRFWQYPIVSAITIDQHCERIDGYLWIPLTVLRAPAFAHVDLFAPSLSTKDPLLLHSAKQDLGVEQVTQIEAHGLNRILVRKIDLGAVSATLFRHIEPLLNDNRFSIADRFALLQIAVWDQVEHNARKIHQEHFVEVAHSVGRQISRLLQDSLATARDIYEHSLHDESRAVHLTNAAAYSVLLAQEMGIREPEDLALLAIGAMLHEFGKLFLPTSLLYKTGRLTVQEREVLESAPQLGYENLSDRAGLKFAQLMMIYQQQERYDGSGYPVGVDTNEIHLWARVLAVADVFDTMTCKKPYRREAPLAEAIQYINDNAFQHFDPQAVQSWMNIFPQQ